MSSDEALHKAKQKASVRITAPDNSAGSFSRVTALRSALRAQSFTSSPSPVCSEVSLPAEIAAFRAPRGPQSAAEPVTEPRKRIKNRCCFQFCTFLLTATTSDRGVAIRRSAVRVLNSRLFQYIILLILLFVIFGVDILELASGPDVWDSIYDGLLITSMVILFAELICNILCRPRFHELEIFMDCIAAASVAADLSWSRKQLQGTNSHTGLRLETATIVAARAGRVVRLLRVFRFNKFSKTLVALTVKALRRGRAMRPVDEDVTIGKRLTDINTLQAALLILVTVTIAPILVYADPSTAARGFVDTLESLEGQPRANMEGSVDVVFRYFERHQFGGWPLQIRVDSETFSAPFWDGIWPRRRDWSWYYSADGRVAMLMNVTIPMQHGAWLNILLAVFIILELGLFIAWLHYMNIKMLVLPLTRILAILRKNARHVLNSVESEDWGDNDMGMMEAAVNKMSRIVRHVSGSGNAFQGQVAVQNIIEDPSTDQDTRRWLESVVSNTAINPHADSFVSSGGAKDSQVLARIPTMDPAMTDNLRFTKSLKPSQDHADMATILRQPSLKPPTPVESRGLVDTLPEEVTSGFDEPGTSLPLEPSALEGMRIRRLVQAVDADAVNSWHFDTLQLQTEDIIAYLCQMFLQLNLVRLDADPICRRASNEQGVSSPESSWSRQQTAGPRPLTDVQTLYTFITKVSGMMNDVPYHNFYHVADVAHTVYRMITLSDCHSCMSQLEKYALMLAAVCHDMDHPGLNNSYLINSRSELARQYNDVSVLENRHASTMYSLLAQHAEADVFRDMDWQTWKDTRKIVVNSILHTDMTYHFPMVSKIEVFHELHAAVIDAAKRGEACLRTSYFETPEERLLMMAIILHTADIANAAKPWHIAERWSLRVMEEFFNQGDREKEEGLPVTPLCDRVTTSLPASQINFLEFIVAPLFLQVVKVLPNLWETLGYLWENRHEWNNQWLNELAADMNKSAADKAAEQDKAATRLQAFQEKLLAAVPHEMRAASMQSRPASACVPSRRESNYVSELSGGLETSAVGLSLWAKTRRITGSHSHGTEARSLTKSIFRYGRASTASEASSSPHAQSSSRGVLDIGTEPVMDPDIDVETGESSALARGMRQSDADFADEQAQPISTSPPGNSQTHSRQRGVSFMLKPVRRCRTSD
ncbi:hypothetical protein WJX74_008239 [Apatococcus lobatus]|uniref:Phosphodiesterase n=1 Tax=Apatococcus lobatus TaxID=904363 RepID=A0AAW1RL00_9CHLO